MGLTSTSQVPSISLPPTDELRAIARESLRRCGVELVARGCPRIAARTPITGENLFEVVGPPADENQVVDAWAAERSAYDYRKNSCSARCGHYTQIVWRDTRQVGCGVAQKNRREIWVCNYDPPGNIMGERPY